MITPLRLIVNKRLEIFMEYQRVMNVESHHPRGSNSYDEFERYKQIDLDKIKSMIDKYDAIIETYK